MNFDIQDILLIFLLVILVITIFAIVYGDVIRNLIDESDSRFDESDSRFIEVYNSNDYTIVVDTTTNVCYLKTRDNLTVLVDDEGKPIVWEEGKDFSELSA